MDIKKLTEEFLIIHGEDSDGQYAVMQHDIELFAQKIIAARDAEWMADPGAWVNEHPRADPEHKLSPWHSSDTKPVHVGVYQVRDLNSYSYWDGKFFHIARRDVKDADMHKSILLISVYQNKQWRGILK